MTARELHSVLESSEVVSLQANDVVLFRTPGHLNMESRERVAAMLEEVFPAHESIILEGGQDIAVLRPKAGWLRRLFRRG